VSKVAGGLNLFVDKKEESSRKSKRNRLLEALSALWYHRKVTLKLNRVTLRR